MSVSAVFAVSPAIANAFDVLPLVSEWTALVNAGQATTTSSVVFAIALPSSHHVCMPAIFLIPLKGLRRPKSGFSFFEVGLNPTCATFTSNPTIIIPSSIGRDDADRLPHRGRRELVRGAFVGVGDRQTHLAQDLGEHDDRA